MNTQTDTRDPVLVQAGEQLRQWRLELGLSQERVANAIDGSSVTVRRHEQGENRPRDENLVAYARVYMRDVSELRAMYRGARDTGRMRKVSESGIPAPKTDPFRSWLAERAPDLNPYEYQWLRDADLPRGTGPEMYDVLLRALRTPKP